MKLYRAILSGVLLPFALAFTVTPAFGAFSNVVQLVLREGDVPTTNGVAIVGAPAYTGTVDTYVDAANPDTSYGSAAIVKFGWPGTTESVKIRGYLRFDSLTNYVPANATVTRTLLYLTSAGSANQSGGGPDIFYRGSTWGESLTWNTDTDYANSVQIGSTYLGTWGLQPSNDVAWLDITAYAQAWQSGTLPNHGLQWRPVGGWSDPLESTYTFHSSEHSETTKRPRLVIDYVEGGYTTRRYVNGVGSYMTLRLECLRGADVFEDTYISAGAPDVNYATAPFANLMTYNNGPERRALFKIKMSHPILAQIAKASDPPEVGRPRLVSAFFQTTGHISWDAPLKTWRLAENWDANQVTHNNRYTNPVPLAWAQGWPGRTTPMSNVIDLVANSTADNQWHRGGTKLTDITSLLQMYADGTNNTGIIYGFVGDAPYDNIVYLTDEALEFKRPTLVIEVWDPQLPGTVILLK